MNGIKINSIILINNYLSNLYPFCSKKEIINELCSIKLPNKQLYKKLVCRIISQLLQIIKTYKYDIDIIKSIINDWQILVKNNSISSVEYKLKNRGIDDKLLNIFYLLCFIEK
jgi:hypothetical protein